MAGGLGEGAASGQHGHRRQDVHSADIQAKDSDSGDKGHSASKKGHGAAKKGHDEAKKGHGAAKKGHDAAKKGHEKSTEDHSATAQVSFEASSPGKGREAVSQADPGNDQVTAEQAAGGAFTPLVSVAGGNGTPRAAVVGTGGQFPVAGPEEGGGTQAPAPSAAAVTSRLGAPLPVPGREAAPQEKGDSSATEAGQAAAQAVGTAVVLAILAARAAEPAPHLGQGAAAPAVAGTGPAVAVTGPADVRLLHGGALAEPAAPGGDAPAPMLGPFPALAAPVAGMLLDRLTSDTRAVDAALQGFLHGLGLLGEPLASQRSRLGVTAWVLTGVAALTALEWGRRRRAAAAGADEVPLSWMDPEGPAL
jgi:hypothetical protein